MKTISAESLKNNRSQWDEVVQVLQDDGLIIFPGESSYRLAAHALSHPAVQALQQAKRRAQNKPSLVFVHGAEQLRDLVESVPTHAQQLIDRFWPGPLTLRLPPSNDLPSKVRKALGKATGKIGVRVPSTEIGRQLVEAFRGPLLISSANRTKKSGAQSLAQVRKNFGNLARLLIDDGDLPPAAPSTVLDITPDGWTLVREGAISRAEIETTLGG